MTDVPLRQIGRQPYSVEVPLFPAYVFCKYDAVALHSFWDISGILSMVQGTDGVNIIPEQEITDLRRTLAAGLSVQPRPFIWQGRIVMVEDGPLSGVTGILKETADERLLILSIELIRRSIAVRIDRLSLEFHSGLVLYFHSEPHVFQANLPFPSASRKNADKAPHQ